MSSVKQIFIDSDIRCGGFFELAIQVSPSSEQDSVRAYRTLIWQLSEVQGPYDAHMNLIPSDPDGYKQEGVLSLGNRHIPFKLHYIKEEPFDSGYNWFTLSIYTATIGRVFDLQYSTFTGIGELPEALDNFLVNLMKSLNKIFPFLLALKDFDITGEYYLENLQKPGLLNWTGSHFYVPQKYWKTVEPGYHSIATVI